MSGPGIVIVEPQPATRIVVSQPPSHVIVSPGTTMSATHHRHVQAIPSGVWNVTHNLGYYPGGITVKDSGGAIHDGLIEYLNINSIRISFYVAGVLAGFSGEAYIS